MECSDMPIDIVYLWVDGNDVEWQQRKQKVTGILSDTSETNNKGRYVSNDELKYALRSVEKNISWIRNIYIVTDNQQPKWLNVAHPQIHLIDHKDIMPSEILPCYNASVIEYYIHKIPGLSERFLFANDDMFFNTKLSPSFFFAEDSKPIVRLKRKSFAKLKAWFRKFVGKQVGQYQQMILDSADRVKKHSGVYYNAVPHHNIDAYNKSTYREVVEEVFDKEVQQSKGHRLRTVGDFHRSTIDLYALANDKGYLSYVDRYTSSRILIYRHDFHAYLDKYQPKLFCLNDNQRVTDQHRQKIVPFLESVFPEKSKFEI